MAVNVEAPSTEGYATFFKQRVVQSARRWQQFVADKQADTAQLEARRERILRAISFALSSVDAWPAARHLIERFAPYMERRGYWDTWQDILTQAIEAAARFGDTAGQITLMALLARLCQRQSRIRETIRLYRCVIRLARRTGNRFEEARACSNLGFLYIDNLGRWQRAEVLCCHALAIFEDLGSDHGRAHTENHLGILYTRQRAWEQAEQHLKQACVLWQAMGDNLSLIYGFENLGMLYFEMERPLEALTYLDQAVNQAQLNGEEIELGTIWSNIGITYRQNGDLEKAELYIKRAENIYRRFSKALGLAQVWNNLGEVYFDQGKEAQARQTWQASLAAFGNLNNWDGQIKVLINLVEAELTVQNHGQAKVHLDKLEDVILQYTQGKQRDYWIQRLEKIAVA